MNTLVTGVEVVERECVGQLKQHIQDGQSDTKSNIVNLIGLRQETNIHLD